MKQFVFLYPIPQIMDFEINQWGRHEKEGKEAYRKRYSQVLNNCIDARYRQNGFQINYAIFDDTVVSDMIHLHQSDRIVEVGLDFKTHTTQKPNGEYTYPNQDYILAQLGKDKVLRVAGFHMWDCVERLAKRGYEKGLDVLVDEDLTEFFPGRLDDPDFKVDKFPTYNPRKQEDAFYHFFMQAREGRPWLWQKY